MIGYLMIAALSTVGGWIYGRMQSRRIEDALNFELSCWQDRCRALKAKLKAREAA